MSLEQLLLRGLIAWFWRAPYPPRGARLARWGTQLHDRFLLPHFVAEDFRTVLADLVRAGLLLEREWFDAHVEFRFPKIGEIACVPLPEPNPELPLTLDLRRSAH